ncbi:TolC family protein [Rhodopirellula sp.]|nr:TolC family protein [Rhodopirellula sp.]
MLDIDHRYQKKALISVLIACAVSFFLTGCSRPWYRQKADQDAYALIREKGGYLDHSSIYPSEQSRLADPYSIDEPPMPKDDPASHRLMHKVDGKDGSDQWHRFGQIETIEPVGWQDSMPRNEEGKIELDLRGAISVGRLNSREYQRQLENLYLSALDVSRERFRFDYQWFADGIVDQNYRGSGIGGRSETGLDTSVFVRKTQAAGGELVVGLANSLLWDVWGSGSDTFGSTLDFALRQPLLRFGGRARVMEQLTQSERDLLANVRQMQQYRQGFYVRLATGRANGSGPSTGSRIGQSGLGIVAGFPSGRNGAPSAGGYLGLLQDQQEIRNQEANVVALRDSAAQLEAAFDANRISSRLQVDQALQALLNAQSSLLASKASYDSRVDAYKISLGLPPSSPITVKDPLLDRFILIDNSLTDLQNNIANALLRIRRGRTNPDVDRMKGQLIELRKLHPDIDAQLELAKKSLSSLIDRIPDRLKQLELVGQQVVDLDADVDLRVYDPEQFTERVDYLKERIPQIIQEFSETRTACDHLEMQFAEDEPANSHTRLVDLTTQFSDLLLELSLVHAEIKLQGISLLPINLEPKQALEIARENRLDWMNARSNLVDSWRKIEVVANDLRSDLDVVITGDLGTKPNHPVAFDTDYSKVRMGLQFDTPTTRLIERNRYRAALITYQQARRDYMLFEDSVEQSLRNTLRIVNLSQINLEVRRAAVRVAIAQVDIARLRLNPPVRPDQPSRTSPTAARDLVSALTDLLNAQNDLLNVWVSYEVLRVLIEFEMGIMEIDDQGIWIDPASYDNLHYESLPVLDRVDQAAFLGDSSISMKTGKASANDSKQLTPVIVEFQE